MIESKKNLKQVQLQSEKILKPNMLNFSISKQNLKKSRSQHTFTDLSQTTSGGQSTKKNIEPEQFNLYMAQSVKSNKFSFSLPYHIEIPTIVSHLTNLFSEDIIHVEEDTQGGKILLHGVKNQNKRRYLINMLDCLGFCCWKFGLNGGSLYESYSVVSISIKKQILNNRCVITIEHLPYHEDDKKIFVQKVIGKIQQQLKKVDSKQEKPLSIQNSMTMTRYLSFDSIFLKQMDIKQKLYNIFVYEKEKKWQRFRRLFRKSEENLAQKIIEYRQKSTKTEQGPESKKGKYGPNPSCLIQAIITETQSLFRTLLNYYQKEVEEHQQHSIMASLLQTPIQKQFTLYSIEQLIASPIMEEVLGFYQQTTEQQSQLFNKNCKQICNKFTNRQCFDYLQLRNKFRLLDYDHPYHPSIETLKCIHNCTSPREMLLNIQKVFSSVKIDCLKASKGRTELSSMDDLLPVMIFVTAKSSVKNFPAFVKLIDDYVKLKGVFQLQERIITTLYVAIEDITKKWSA